MKANSFFAFLRRMRYIRRWGLMRNTEEENILEHSMETAFIAHNLGLLHNQAVRTGAAEMPVDEQRLAVMAMYHEVSEIFTGDMPTPIKYFDARLRSLYGDIEAQARERLLGTLPEELRAAYAAVIGEPAEDIYRRLLKAADTLAAFMKCIAERRAGNDEFDEAYTTIYEKLTAMKMPAVDRFMALYLPALGCSLDELNRSDS